MADDDILSDVKDGDNNCDDNGDSHYFTVVDDIEMALKVLPKCGYLLFDVYNQYGSPLSLHSDIDDQQVVDGTSSATSSSSTNTTEVTDSVFTFFCLSLTDHSRLIYQFSSDQIPLLKPTFECRKLVKVSRRSAILSRWLMANYSININSVIDLNVAYRMVNNRIGINPKFTIHISEERLNNIEESCPERNMFRLAKIWLQIYDILYSGLIMETEECLKMYQYESSSNNTSTNSNSK